MTRRLGCAAVLFMACQLAGPIANAENVLMFAAASTAVALEDVIRTYSQTSAGRVRASYASSGALARQLDNGAPASLFLSANTKWMDWAEKNGLLATDTRTTLLRNRLVLVQSGSKAMPFIERNLLGWLKVAQGHRLAIADPAHAPAGEYVRQALTSLGMWNSFSNLTVRAQNVRAALLLVERQEVSYGIVYGTDAHSSKATLILAAFPKDSHSPILYDLALTRNRDTPGVRRFYDYLRSTEGQKIFRRFKFLAP